MSLLQVIAYEVWSSRSFVEVGKVQQFDYGVKCMPDRVWPKVKEDQAECGRTPGHIWRPAGSVFQMPSNISCIKFFGKHTPSMDDGSNVQDAMYPFIISNFDTLISCYFLYCYLS